MLIPITSSLSLEVSFYLPVIIYRGKLEKYINVNCDEVKKT